MVPLNPIGGPEGPLKHLLKLDPTRLDRETLPAHLPPSHLPGSEFRFTPNTTIQGLINSGDFTEALKLSAQNYFDSINYKGEHHQFTFNYLANLLEHSVRTNDSSFVEPRFVEALASQALDSNLAPGTFRMRILSRLTEFSSHFGVKQRELRETAELGVECLHQLYPLANIRDDLKAYSARTSLVSLRDVASWELQKTQPDMRELDYMAEYARARLEIFDAPKSEFYFSLYQLQRGKLDDALARLDHLVESATDSDTEIVTCALEAPIPALFKAKRNEEGSQRLNHLQSISDTIESLEERTRINARILNLRDKHEAFFRS